MTLDKTFDPAAIEAKWYEHWETTGAFRPDRPGAVPYTIVNPPPNVTGSLHIGHALDNTLQDILIRHARLQGKDALWVVGTDHAGIATQMVVERQMDAKGQKRTDFSRDDFIAKVWEWKEESGGEITGQLRRLGCSMDWSREQFTMDPHFTRAVIKVFVDLYNEGLIYRDKRLVNWDPHFKSAISDLEVETREVNGHMWHFKYPLAGGEKYTYVERDQDGNITLSEERDYISIATTRPETMLGDGAVAVHPGDERYSSIVGKLCEIPVGPKEHRRLIPIITDEYPDPDFGSGAVKITGAHDQNDYGVAQRNNIPMYRLMDENAAMRDDGTPYEAAAMQAKAIAAGSVWSAATIDALNLVPDTYRGLDRYEARKRVIADIDADGLMIKVEGKLIQQPFGDRSGVVIEPMLTDQWYVDAATLAKPAIDAVRSGAIDVVPKSWEKTYFNWMENIQPWCVSRQLWWGHRIPAWFDGDGNIYVAETETAASALAGAGVALEQDPDVLDTWFSSALWPFATLGWPNINSPLQGEDLLSRHYPNDVLVSGFDILFFWDARMAMQGLHFMGDVPWKTLYLHGLVRAADGSKMSKSKGNTVDPLGLIDQYGADALRFFMAAMESQGRDIKMDEGRVAGYRNFATKLWNAARFCEANGISASKSVAAPQATLAVNRWIIGEVVETLAKLDKAFAEFRFDGMADTIYHFVWDRFCDWYLELIKPVLSKVEGPVLAPPLAGEDFAADETRAVAGWVLDQILVMLHPFMPFITEELWNKIGDRGGNLLIHAQWPAPAAVVDMDAASEIDWLIRLTSEVRSAKNELGIAPGAKMQAYVRDAAAVTKARLESQSITVARLARLNSVSFDTAPMGGSIQIIIDEATFVLPLEGVIDLDAERARITKAMEAAAKEAKSLEARLNTPAFIEKAKPEAVAKARADHAEKSAEVERLKAALARLG
ncbi:MAG: valine--tRNA ligase [Parasphingorhabdus sp.]|nr:valine--tRNA ligase [Parasphingorhabdus sp.]